jgi:thiamine biosynthesis protein ThiS
VTAELHLTVNGQSLSVPAGTTIATLLVHLALDRGRVAVEHNLRVVPRAEHPVLHLADGDSLEIVTFVGGG